MKTLSILQTLVLGLGLLAIPAMAAPAGFYLAAAGGQAEQHIDLKDSGRGFINITTPFRTDAARTPFALGSTLDVDGKAFGWNVVIGYRVNA